MAIIVFESKEEHKLLTRDANIVFYSNLLAVKVKADEFLILKNKVRPSGEIVNHDGLLYLIKEVSTCDQEATRLSILCKSIRLAILRKDLRLSEAAVMMGVSREQLVSILSNEFSEFSVDELESHLKKIS